MIPLSVEECRIFFRLLQSQPLLPYLHNSPYSCNNFLRLLHHGASFLPTSVALLSELLTQVLLPSELKVAI